MMTMSQVWAVIGIMGTAFAAMIGLVFRAMSQHGNALTAEVGALHHKIDAKLDGLRNEMLARFDQVSAQFGQVSVRFDHVSLRFDHVSLRFDHVSSQFDHLSERIDRLTNRVDKLESRVETIDREVHSLTLRVMGNEPPKDE